MKAMTRRLFLAASSLEMMQAGADTPTDSERAEHEKYMRRAIELAANNRKAPFGALLVDRERKKIMAEGWNKSAQHPAWHGEMDAINRCVEQHGKPEWARLTLYTTAEPCSMCQSAVIWAGIPLVVYGTSVSGLLAMGWNQIGIPADEVVAKSPFRRCRVVGGVLEKECNALFVAARAK